MATTKGRDNSVGDRTASETLKTSQANRLLHIKPCSGCMRISNYWRVLRVMHTKCTARLAEEAERGTRDAGRTKGTVRSKRLATEHIEISTWTGFY